MKNGHLSYAMCLVFTTLFSIESYCEITNFQETTKHWEITKHWETRSQFSAPESTLYDTARNAIYVSNYNDQGGFKRSDQGISNEFISKLNKDGSIQALKWINNLHNPTGMAIYKDALYIVIRDGVAIANLDSGVIERRIDITDNQFLNDIAIDEKGDIYISDSGLSRIYKIKDDITEIWLEGGLINSPNGLYIDGSNLIVGNKGEGNLLSVSLLDQSQTILGKDISGKIDGIQKYKEGYLVSWASKLHYIVDGNKTLVYRLKNKKDFFADFELIENENLMIVPMLVSGKVAGLKID